MGRQPKNLAMYEAIRKSQGKHSITRTLEKIQEIESEKTQASVETSERAPDPKVKWSAKAQIASFHKERLEFSLPYPLAIVIVLGLIFAVLMAFRLGQMQVRPETASVAETTNKIVAAVKKPAMTANIVQPEKKAVVVQEPAALASPFAGEAVSSLVGQGVNKIVIVEYKQRTDLEPVRKYFSQNGIETEIVRLGNSYFLATVKKYENFSPNTDGYEILQKIKEVGGNYKAPDGYETFGKKPFQDAYGRKF